MPDAPRPARLTKAEAVKRLAKARARREEKIRRARQRADAELWQTAVTVQDASGLTQKEVADALDFHRETVRTHTRRARDERGT